MSLTFKTIQKVKSEKGIKCGGSESKLKMTSSLADENNKDDPAFLMDSLESISRSTFHNSKSMNDVVVKESCSGDSDGTSTGAGAGTGAGSGAASEPSLKKPGTTFRIRCNHQPVETIVETISIALIDPHKESYGQAKNRKRSSIDIKFLAYSYSDLSFQPDECTWEGQVHYSCQQTIKSVTHLSGTTKILVENNFNFSVQCQIVTCDESVNNGGEKKDTNDDENDDNDNGNDNDDGNDNDNDNGNDRVNVEHYSIDIQAILGSYRKDIDTHRVISQTIKYIECDIARALNCLSLPNFPEGCGELPFCTTYHIDSILRSGSFGTVCRGTHIATKKQVAVKCIKRRNIDPILDVAILKEVNILGSLNHKYICPIIDFFIEDEYYLIVMELMEGGDVFHRVSRLKKYNEENARDLGYQVLEAIAYCHENNIAHCDIKHNNILLQSKDDDASIKLGDFGFASHVFGPKTLTHKCGTPFFIAPEIIQRIPYDQSVDMWSVGVMIFCLLSGEMPFRGKTRDDLGESIIAGNFNFDSEAWDAVSDDVKHLISNLLVTDPNKRYTATEALQSEWFRDENRLRLSYNKLNLAQSQLKTFNARLKFKSAVLTAQSVIRWKKYTRESQERRK